MHLSSKWMKLVAKLPLKYLSIWKESTQELYSNVFVILIGEFCFNPKTIPPIMSCYEL